MINYSVIFSGLDSDIHVKAKLLLQKLENLTLRFPDSLILEKKGVGNTDDPAIQKLIVDAKLNPHLTLDNRIRFFHALIQKIFDCRQIASPS